MPTASLPGPPPPVLIFGPTAVGKTSCIERLGVSLDVPISVISADSMQVYRGMDIGTAKPDAALRDRIPHYCIDLLAPDQQYDVGAFVRDASAAARAAADAGRLPVVCGGTAYYLKHLMFGMPGAPPSSEEIRLAVHRELEERGLEALRGELLRVDPVTAARVGLSDRYRIARALEVYRETGRPLSSFTVPSGPPAGSDTLAIGLDRPRDELTARIGRRVQAMFASGLRAEVEQLVERGYQAGDPGLRAIGYREFFTRSGALRPATEDETIAGEIDLDTRRYAKRQLTFFRRLPGVTWLPAADADAVVERVHAYARRHC